MKVIVVGNGGREHAIAWKLAQSMSVSEVICVPGNGGTAHEAKCRNIHPDECDYIEEGTSENDIYVQIARHEGCTLAVIGPENPLAAGLADFAGDALESAAGLADAVIDAAAGLAEGALDVATDIAEGIVDAASDVVDALVGDTQDDVQDVVEDMD